MMIRSYTNLLDLATGNFPVMKGEGEGEGHREGRRLGAMSVPNDVFNFDDQEPQSARSGNQSSLGSDRMIIVANILPLKATRSPDDRGWIFSWNEDSVLLRLKDGLPEDMVVQYVGCLCVDVEPIDQDDVAHYLLEKFKCIPTFLSPKILEKYYEGFCKKHLWPLFHYMLPFSPEHGSRFDRCLWEAYVSVNKTFSQKVVEVLNPDYDFVWIHDYHLMVLPTFLRRRFNRLRMGFFFHSTFPSSEIYRALPVREEILKALLCSDLIGFHNFDYARHFLSCCSRMLGVEYQSKRGYIGLEYYGRTVTIKIMPVGIHMGHIESLMRLSDKEMKFKELREQFEGKTVLLGVDDMDIFKGINLKLLAIEHMLKEHPNWQGKAVLVQIATPARGKGINLEQIENEIQESCKRIRKEFGKPGYEPIIFIDTPISSSEKMAYYSIAECLVTTPVRDGMNLKPYEYIVCRQGIPSAEADSDLGGPKKSMLVLSEFIGCSPSLSGAIRVNPWNVEATAEAMNEALSMAEPEKQLRHEKHYRYVSTHDVAYWSRSFLQDLEKTCVDHFTKRCYGIGLGFGFRVVALDPNFRKLSIEEIVSAYFKAKNRAILLDYDGTVIPQSSIIKSPSAQVLTVLNKICSDKKNTVFIVSGRGRDNLSSWCSPCQKLGLAAEHGYFMRWSQDHEWEQTSQNSDFGWMQLAEPVMQSYTDATDGSCIEKKESAIVWQYSDADPSFGYSQAKEMLDHLESVLSHEPVAVKSGRSIVELKPQGVNKGLVAEKIFTSMAEGGKLADFVLCIGDDRSDEDMFEIIGSALSRNILSQNTKVFACTVGQKPSKAKYYLDDPSEVILMLESLAETSDTPADSDEEADNPA
ncbi:PREDICTED: probable alpha,alpha-trehalose-phosphate synthase [UDP-forming] 7 [Ipomoea nil]|uniref:probable alpha,alpha-trehalose-phosphate synthase [UDP-forming] 7 n=1 Tax=Ipomoea nil TaxID=35883 RepID=UPI000900C154|nr:PREDICTED: probable alpha,alpha-trehalose-phosphate synthase [UDP-forming] 7 [Ipomoea nil]